MATSDRLRDARTPFLSADGTTIAGRWGICHDEKTWELDFDLTYDRA